MALDQPVSCIAAVRALKRNLEHIEGGGFCMNNENNNQVELATDITVAWLSNSSTRAVDDVPTFLKTVHDAIGALMTPASDAVDQEPAMEYTPAVSVRKSLADPNFIVSMIDGRKYRSLKRHLGANGLTPDEYRARFGLKASYPMTAPGYSQARSEVAKKLGLGRKKGEAVEKKVVADAAAADKPAPKERKARAAARTL